WPEPFVRIHQRLVAQKPLGLRDVGQRVGHVAGARRGVFPLEAPTEDRLEPRDDLEQAHAAAAPDVERFAPRVARPGRQEIGLDDVVDVREVTGLVAVAVDLERTATQPPEDEPWDHRRVLGFRILPRPEDGEVAQTDRLYAVEVGPDGGVLLTGRLGHGVRRDRRRWLILALGKLR